MVRYENYLNYHEKTFKVDKVFPNTSAQEAGLIA